MFILKHTRSRCTGMLLAALLLVAVAMPAQATVTGGSVIGGSAFSAGGVFVKLTVPLTGATPFNSVGADTFDDYNLYAFDEDQNIFVPFAIAVDDLFGPVGPGLVPAGSVVASHYIFFDPAGSETMIGTVTFDSDILGVISSKDNLDASDFLANTGVTYLSPSLRGLEVVDSVIILDSRTIQISVTASSPGDYIRVLTTHSPGTTPEPLTATLGLISAGAIGLTVSRRRRAR